MKYIRFSNVGRIRSGIRTLRYKSYLFFRRLIDTFLMGQLAACLIAWFYAEVSYKSAFYGLCGSAVIYVLKSLLIINGRQKNRKKAGGQESPFVYISFRDLMNDLKEEKRSALGVLMTNWRLLLVPALLLGLGKWYLVTKDPGTLMVVVIRILGGLQLFFILARIHGAYAMNSCKECMVNSAALSMTGQDQVVKLCPYCHTLTRYRIVHQETIAEKIGRLARLRQESRNRQIRELGSKVRAVMDSRNLTLEDMRDQGMLTKEDYEACRDLEKRGII